MRRPLLGGLAALALGLAGGALLGGCGSATKTVSVAEATAPSEPATTATQSATTTATATATATTSTTSTTTTPLPASTAGGTAGPTTTRSASEPAFTETTSHAEGLGEAVGLLAARGYTPLDTSDYHPNQTLRVLIGSRTGSTDGYGQQAFFFVDDHYIGTDAKEPSATVKVVSQSDTEVVLSYPLYRKSDPLCCPGGGSSTVRFQLNNGKLTPLDPIPPANSASGYSRN
jgi:hypothetical protein